MNEKPSKLRSALIGGLVIGAVSGIPGISLINCCCCAGIWLGGLLTLYLYKKEFTEGMLPLESSDALLVGLMSGVAGAFIATAISVLILVSLGPIQEEFARSLVEKFLDRMAEGGGIPTEMVDQMKEEFERSLQDSTRISGILGSLFITLIVYPIFSMLGGLLGYAIFRPKTPPQQATPMAP